MTNITASVEKAFHYTIDNTFKKPGLLIGYGVILLISSLVMTFGIMSLVIPAMVQMIPEYTAQFTAEELALLSEAGILPGVICIIISLIPMLFIAGTVVRILGRREITFKGVPGTTGRGVQYLFINLIYSLPVIIIAILTAIPIFAPLAQMTTMPGLTTDEAAAAGFVVLIGLLCVWTLIYLVFAVLTATISLPASVNFARQEKFSAAFAFKEIFALIRETKWHRILGALIVLILIVMVVSVGISLLLGLVSVLLMFIPIIGVVLMLLIQVVVNIILEVCIIFFSADFFAEFFENEAAVETLAE